mmetsp:Transcript_17866/g.31084  ORF Transcript_17866/g.31084 Transcript_17866/m.31084 type:complete len:259 (+) Transcript_17866:609-1385(+)
MAASAFMRWERSWSAYCLANAILRRVSATSSTKEFFSSIIVSMRYSSDWTFFWEAASSCSMDALCSSATTLARLAILLSSLIRASFCSSSVARARWRVREATCSSASAQRRSALSRSCLSAAAPRSICSIVVMMRSLLFFATRSCSARWEDSSRAALSWSLAIWSCSWSRDTALALLSSSVRRRATSWSLKLICSAKVRPCFFSSSSRPATEEPSKRSLLSSSSRRRTSSSFSRSSPVFSFSSFSRCALLCSSCFTWR